MIWGSVVVVVEEEVVVEEVVEEEAVVEEALVEEVVVEEVVAEVVVAGLPVPSDGAKVVDVLAPAVVNDDTPPPHALRKATPTMTMMLGAMPAKSFLILDFLPQPGLLGIGFTGLRTFPACVLTHRGVHSTTQNALVLQESC